MSDVEARIDKIEGDLYRAEPENPGALIRLDRIERLLQTMLRIGYVVGGAGLLLKALDVVGEIFAAQVKP